MPPTDGRKPFHEELRQSTPFLQRERCDYGELAATQATRFTIPRATSCRDAVRMRRIRCVPRCICIRYRRDLSRRSKSTMRIHDRQPRRQIEAYETQFYRPTPSGRRRRLGAPWLPLRTSLRCLPPKRDSTLRCLPPKRDSTLRCLPPKRDSIRCGAYAPKRYEIRCGVPHQSSTALYAEVLANQSYELCGGVYHQCTTIYAAVLTRQCSTSYAEVSYTEAL